MEEFGQWAALVGTVVGSLVASYFAARSAANKRMEQDALTRPTEPPALPIVDPALVRRVETLERELRQEVRILEGRLAEALTLEEFQTYTSMDSQRREKLIEKIGELQGTIAAVLPRMRR